MPLLSPLPTFLRLPAKSTKMKHGRGALTPPGFYSEQEAAAKTLASMPGYLDYALVAGVNGMAIRVEFDSVFNAQHAAMHYKGTWHEIPQTGAKVLYGLVKGVEVFYSPAGMPQDDDPQHFAILA